MQLTPHFSIKEFTYSETALRHKLDNSIPADKMADAVLTAQMMERIRAHLSAKAGKDISIRINSAWRSPEVNTAVGSGRTSDHLKMAAVDFTADGFGDAYAICKALVPVLDQLGVGQIIFEHSWTHVSRLKPIKTINRVITVQGGDYVPGIQR